MKNTKRAKADRIMKKHRANLVEKYLKEILGQTPTKPMAWLFGIPQLLIAN